MERSWIEKLSEQLAKEFDHTQARELANQYHHAYPLAYMEDTPAEFAVSDILSLQQLSTDKPITLKLYVIEDSPDFP
jgi:glutamate dehydrogenase